MSVIMERTCDSTCAKGIRYRLVGYLIPSRGHEGENRAFDFLQIK